MLKLSNREKSFLFILALVLVFFVGSKFVLLPTIDAIQSAEDELYKLEDLKMEYESMIAVKDKLEQENEELTEEFKDYEDIFYPMLYNEEIDSRIQEYTKKHNLFCSSSSFGDTDYASLVSFNGTAADDPSLFVNSVVINGIGEMDDVAAFLDDLAKLDSMKVTSSDIEIESTIAKFMFSIDVYMRQ